MHKLYTYTHSVLTIFSPGSVSYPKLSCHEKKIASALTELNLPLVFHQQLMKKTTKAQPAEMNLIRSNAEWEKSTQLLLWPLYILHDTAATSPPPFIAVCSRDLSKRWCGWKFAGTLGSGKLTSHCGWVNYTFSPQLSCLSVLRTKRTRRCALHFIHFGFSNRRRNVHETFVQYCTWDK